VRVLVCVTIAIALTACSGGEQSSSASDAYLATAVRANLATVDVDSATAVNVEASNGVVTLTGAAHTELERLEYSHAARSIAGVRSVDDRLLVNPHMQGLRQQSGDATLAARVSTAIAAQAGINVFNVRIAAQNGVVTLEGTVPSQSIEQTIVETARGISGVRRVNSAIVVAR